ncbi:hypothetical protein AgCh_036896 [Apium graveolens]
MTELNSMLKECGNLGGHLYYFKLPKTEMERSLWPLETDSDVMDMTMMLPTDRLIYVYAVTLNPLVVVVDGQPTQEFAPSQEVDLEFVDLTSEPDHTCQMICLEDMVRDLSDGDNQNVKGDVDTKMQEVKDIVDEKDKDTGKKEDKSTKKNNNEDTSKEKPDISSAEEEGYASDVSSQYAESDEKMMACNSSDDEEISYPVFNFLTDMKEPKGKKKALQSINGKHVDQYGKVWEYGNEMLQVIPDSTIFVMNGEEWKETAYPKPLPPEVWPQTGRSTQKKTAAEADATVEEEANPSGHQDQHSSVTNEVQDLIHPTALWHQIEMQVHMLGAAKTHELEMEQRSKRNGRKSRTVAFVAEDESPKVVASKKGKGKALFTKSDTESSSSESDDDSETKSIPEMDPDEEMMKLYALMVKGIKKIAYWKFRRGKKFSRKGASSDKRGFRKSEGKEGKSDRGDYSNVKCYKCGEKGISPDCRKGKNDKDKALVTKKKSWSDASDSENEENYALMANANSSFDTADLKIPQTTYAFHTDDITELRRYLKTMFISYKDQTLTSERLTSENLVYKKGNDYLEKKLVIFHQTRKDRDDASYVRDEVLKMNESLKTELEKEREIIRTWTNSGKATQDILSYGNWKEGLGYGDDKNSKGTVETEPIVVKQKPKVNPVKFVTAKSDIEKSEVKEKVTSEKPKQDKPTELNIGLMTKKQLKHKLKDVKNVNKGNMKNILVLDSGCSGHMTGNKALLSDFVGKAGPGVSYGDGNIGKTLGYGNINLGNVIIEKAALVSGLKHNLLSVSQICDRGYHVDFFEEHCEVKAKQRKSSFKSKTESSILEPYHLLHVDLFGPVNVMSIAKKKYAMVIVDEFTRYTWVYFLHTKSETASVLIDHVKQLDKLVKDSVKIIRSDNGTEFKNLIMEEFCKDHGIKQEFSAPVTPQQNGVVERKNRTLIEAARTMLDEAKLPTYFWDEAVQNACFTQNATLINKHGKIPYEMVKKKNPNLKYFHVFGCKCFVLKTHPEQLSKFDLKADEGIFVGYPLSIKAFRVYDLRTRVVMESINVSFDDKKITRLEDFNDHDQLRFENEVLNSDSVNPDTANSDGLNC